jgi:transposase-like protein
MDGPVRCPSCGSPFVFRVKRKLVDRLASLLGLYPFVCESCNNRFRAVASNQPKIGRIGRWF